PRPTPDFTGLGYDSLLATDVLVRDRHFAPNLLATFPAVAGVSTIVVGLPAATNKNSTEWVLTLLHEHFHQLQTSRPGYYARFAAARYTPSAAFTRLPDFVPYATAADRIEANVRAGLRGSSLERGNRVAFYPAGAAYALMLDRMVPGWRGQYFDRAMSLDAM